MSPATLRAKLGLERAPYLTLAACNLRLAHRALETDLSIGALLPFDEILRASDGSRERIRRVPDAVVATTTTADRPTVVSSAPTHPRLS